MKNNQIDFVYILLTILFTVIGQIMLKLRVSKYGEMPIDTLEKIYFLLKFFVDPGILFGIACGFLASMAWMAAMTKYDLSVAYPFMSLNFVIVLIISCLMLGESLTYGKVFGVLMIVIGSFLSVL